jgi:hypothetical protein
MSSRRAIVSSVIVVFQGSGYGLSNPTLTKFIAMAAIIQAAASYTTSGDTIPGNSQMITLALKNRSRAASGWYHDIQKTELTGADGGAIQTEVRTTIDATALAPEARAALRAAILAAQGASGG